MTAPSRRGFIRASVALSAAALPTLAGAAPHAETAAVAALINEGLRQERDFIDAWRAMDAMPVPGGDDIAFRRLCRADGDLRKIGRRFDEASGSGLCPGPATEEGKAVAARLATFYRTGRHPEIG